MVNILKTKHLCVGCNQLFDEINTIRFNEYPKANIKLCDECLKDLRIKINNYYEEELN